MIGLPTTSNPALKVFIFNPSILSGAIFGLLYSFLTDLMYWLKSSKLWSSSSKLLAFFTLQWQRIFVNPINETVKIEYFMTEYLSILNLSPVSSAVPMPLKGAKTKSLLKTSLNHKQIQARILQSIKNVKCQTKNLIFLEVQNHLKLRRENEIMMAQIEQKLNKINNNFYFKMSEVKEKRGQS